MSTSINVILGIFGGLGLFMYGFHITGKSLHNFVSFRFRNLLERLTKNVFMSTIMGFFMTALVQSSSATLVFLINFIDAGLISLSNSMGVIFGANIGSTITVQVISFSLERYVIPAIGLGAILKLFAKKRSLKMFGELVLGFAIIFLGIMIMKDAVTPLKEYAFFREFMSLSAQRSLYGMTIAF
ncbi:MAG TPA: Na/Pi symporter, partial [bacterium]|nr:Na/Pi symporter [bacterium]